MVALNADFTQSIEFGAPREVADGVFWLRLPLPARLDHVNVYLIDDVGGWLIFDTGIGDDRTRDIWRQVLAGGFRGRPVTRLVVSHFHTDHVGLAGWLSEHYGLQPLMTRKEHAITIGYLTIDDSELESNWHQYYRDVGFDTDAATKLSRRRWFYRDETSGLPETVQYLADGDRLTTAGRSWQVIASAGHSVEQIMLSCAEDRILLAADHLLPVISPNIGFYVHHRDPDDPLGSFLNSLSQLESTLAADTLVLPGHQLPFQDAHDRIAELQGHHAERCALILDACRLSAKSCKDLQPVLFDRALQFSQLSFAFGETLAHIKHLCRTGDLLVERSDAGGLAYRTASNAEY